MIPRITPENKPARVLCVLLACAFLLCFSAKHLSAAAPAPAPSSSPVYNVGYRVLDLAYRENGRDRPVTVAVWYPTVARPKPHTYGGPTEGKIAVNAIPYAEGAPYPLLVFSHGYGGSGLGAIFLAEALAAGGWIVACPDHHDRHSAVRIRVGQVKDFDRKGLLQHAGQIAASGPGDRNMYLYRLNEMRAVLGGVLTSSPFGRLIDRNRIAVGGHSLGGFTALGLSGTIPEFHDPRIRAVLLLSTGAGGYLFTDAELAAVRIPSMLFMGERERDQTRGSSTMQELSARIYRNAASPKYFLEVKGAGHFSFNNGFSEKLSARLLSGTEAQFNVINRYSIAFLEKHVAGKKDPDRILEQRDPLLTRYERD